MVKRRIDENVYASVLSFYSVFIYVLFPSEIWIFWDYTINTTLVSFFAMIYSALSLSTLSLPTPSRIRSTTPLSTTFFA